MPRDAEKGHVAGVGKAGRLRAMHHRSGDLRQAGFKGVAQLGELATALGELGLGVEAPEETWQGSLEPWVGHYADDTFRVRLFLQGGELVLASSERQRPVRVLADGSFDWNGTEFEGEPGSDGRIGTLRFFYGAQEVVLRRFEPPSPETLDLQELAGTYRSPELGLVARLEATPEGLVASWKGRAQGFVPTLPDRFHIHQGRVSSLAVTRDASDRVTGFRLDLLRSRNLRFEREDIE